MQGEELLAKLHPIYEGQSTAPAQLVFNAFRASVEARTAWIFPERDSIGQQLEWAMGVVQESLLIPLESSGLMSRKDIEEFINLHLIIQAAKRQEKLHRNRIIWRLVLARFMYWLGSGRRTQTPKA